MQGTTRPAEGEVGPTNGSAAIEDRKVLLTGATGVLGTGIARSLAATNDVWAIARFRDPGARAALEAAGVTCVPVDLDRPDFAHVPGDFDHVVHMAVTKRADFDADIVANVEALGMLMAHCRAARSFLHVSSTAVYQPNGHHAFAEDAPLGDNHRVALPTYSLCKIAAETMARFCARQFSLPTTIARLNVPYGNSGGWPAMHLESMLAGQPVAVHTDAPSTYNPIHEDDLVRQVPLLLQAAAVPATIVNWAGDQAVSIEEWCTHLAAVVGVRPTFVHTGATLRSVVTDTTKLRSLVGPTTVDWRDGMRRMAEHLYPDRVRR